MSGTSTVSLDGEPRIRPATIAADYDTFPSMTAALALYRSLGFRDVEAYRDNPIAGATFRELAAHAVRPRDELPPRLAGGTTR